MSTESKVTNYWREEFGLLVILLILFCGIIGFGINLPFDAKLFPLIIGAAGILLCAVITIQELGRKRAAEQIDVVPDDDPAANATWPRLATALLSAPVFGVVFWLFGFFVASIAAMFAMPPLMGYSNRRMMVMVGIATVAFLAVFFPYLVGVNLPHGVVGDWLLDQIRPH